MDAFKEIVKKQAWKLKEPSDELLDSTKNRFANMADKCLEGVEQFPTLRNGIQNALESLLETLYDYAKDQIDEFFAQQEFPYCTVHLQDALPSNNNTATPTKNVSAKGREETDYNEMKAKVSTYEEEWKRFTEEILINLIHF